MRFLRLLFIVSLVLTMVGSCADYSSLKKQINNQDENIAIVPTQPNKLQDAIPTRNMDGMVPSPIAQIIAQCEIPNSGDNISKSVQDQAKLQVSYRLGSKIQKIIWSPDDQLIAVLTGENVVVIDPSTNQIITTIDEKNAEDILFSPDNAFLLTLGTSAKLWRVDNWQVFREFWETVEQASFSPDGDHIAIAKKSSVEIYDLGLDLKYGDQEDIYSAYQFSTLIQVPTNLSNPSVRGVTYSPDGSLIAIINNDYRCGSTGPAEILLYNPTTSELLQRIFPNHAQVDWEVSFSRDGSILTYMSSTCPTDNTRECYREFRATLNGDLLDEVNSCSGLQFSRSNDVFLGWTIGEEWEQTPLGIWHAKDGDIELDKELCLDIGRFELLPMGNKVLIGEANGSETYLYDIDREIPIVKFPYFPYAPTFTFSHDEQLAASFVSRDLSGEISFWSIVDN